MAFKNTRQKKNSRCIDINHIYIYTYVDIICVYIYIYTLHEASPH